MPYIVRNKVRLIDQSIEFFVTNTSEGTACLVQGLNILVDAALLSSLFTKVNEKELDFSLSHQKQWYSRK